MENFKIKVENIQAKHKCLFLKEMKYIFPLIYIYIYIYITRLITKRKENSQLHGFEIPTFPV
jgi:hypothetical protein